MGREVSLRLRPAVFCDRDGTLNEDADGYISAPERLVLFPGVTGALRDLAQAGYALVVVSNQSGVGRGIMSLRDLERVNERFVELLEADGVRLDGLYFCPHAPEEGCECRKPRPGMLQRAARELGIDLARSWMVGDKVDDVLAGRAAGCRAVLIRAGAGEGCGPECGSPDLVAEDFPQAARRILGSGA